MKTYLTLLLLFIIGNYCKATEKQKPNIVIIYVDDLGYGDVSCNGATEVHTPNIDALAAEGIRFTDAHCSASTCTPSRYSLLTGNYAFRENAGILEGNAPALIKPGTPTLASMLKKHGYSTAVIGKWHLGLGNGNIDWNHRVSPGPAEIGFDYSYLIPATGDRVPCVLLENQKAVDLDPYDPIKISYKKKIGSDPTFIENPDLAVYGADKQHGKTIVNGVSRIGYMTGGNSARWKDETMQYKMLNKACQYIDDNAEKPFFLYFAFHDIHVPRLPDTRFKGATDMGPRGDAIVQMDYITGQLVKHLERKGLKNNTLIVFSSDNGPVLSDGYDDKAIELLGNHKPASIFRGGKYSSLEAGTRVPTIVSWPVRIPVSKVSNALIGHVDLYASIAELVGASDNEIALLDSQNLLPVWLGETDKGREFLLEESFTFSLRYKNYKYIAPVETRKQGAWIDKGKKIESGSSIEEQLFNLSKDPQEKVNIANKEKSITKKIKEKLKSITE